MTTPISLLPRGTTFVRTALALLRAGEGGIPAAVEHAQMTWGAHSAPALALKAAVETGSTADGNWASGLSQFTSAAAEFLELVRPLTVIGRLSGLRRVPFTVRTLRQTAGASAYWIGEGAPKPVSRLSFDDLQTLDPRKVAGTVVITDELARSSDPAAEPLIRADLVSAVTEIIDTSFLNPTNAGIAGIEPASITYDAPTIESSGDPRDDLSRLIGAFPGRIELAYFTMRPETATRLALARDSGGAFLFPDLGPRGGSLLGIPVLTSRILSEGSPQEDLVTLVDPSGITIGEGELMIDRAREATLQMDDNPTTPDASTVFVSLWQMGLQALRVERYMNWRTARPSVAVLTGATYVA